MRSVRCLVRLVARGTLRAVVASTDVKQRKGSAVRTSGSCWRHLYNLCVVCFRQEQRALTLERALGCRRGGQDNLRVVLPLLKATAPGHLRHKQIVCAIQRQNVSAPGCDVWRHAIGSAKSGCGCRQKIHPATCWTHPRGIAITGFGRDVALSIETTVQIAAACKCACWRCKVHRGLGCLRRHCITHKEKEKKAGCGRHGWRSSATGLQRRMRDKDVRLKAKEGRKGQEERQEKSRREGDATAKGWRITKENKEGWRARKLKSRKLKSERDNTDEHVKVWAFGTSSTKAPRKNISDLR